VARKRMEVDARRAQLVAIGLRAFSHRAYDDVSMEDLARAAKISKGLVYHYFPTKRRFYVAALREAARQLLARTEPNDDDPPKERLKKGLESYVAFVDEHARAYATLMRGGADRESRAVVDKTREALVARLYAAPELRGALTPRVRLAIRGFVGFVEATALEWVERREISRAELVDMWIATLFFSAVNASSSS